MESWLRAHVHTFEHFWGFPVLVVPDNAKDGSQPAGSPRCCAVAGEEVVQIQY